MNMIDLTCSFCGKSLRANDADAGKKTRCTGCKAVLAIPTPEQPQAPLPEPALNDHIQTSARPFPNLTPPNTVTCPHCAGPIIDEPEVAGRWVQCPHCQGTMQMPGTPVDVELVPISNSGPMVTFRCPHCQSVQTFAMEFAGSVAKCPKCSYPVQIPVPQGQPVGSSTDSSKASPRKPGNEFDFDAVLDAEGRREAEEWANQIGKSRQWNRCDDSGAHRISFHSGCRTGDGDSRPIRAIFLRHRRGRPFGSNPRSDCVTHWLEGPRRRSYRWLRENGIYPGLDLFYHRDT